MKEENKEGNVDSNAPHKVKAIDELQRMNIKQLREEAATRGISASGTKKELMDRLCTNNANVSSDNDLGNRIGFFYLLLGKSFLHPLRKFLVWHIRFYYINCKQKNIHFCACFVSD